MYPVDALTEQLLQPARLQRFRQVLDRRLGSLTLVLEHLVDPRNICAILRSAEAFGVQHVHVVAPQGYAPNRGITRKADRWLSIHRHPDAAACLEHLRAAGYSLWGASLAADAQPAFALPLPPRLALLVGNEHDGLSPAADAACDHHVIIPMDGFTQSLNVSVAATILLQRYTHSCRDLQGPAALLPAAEREALFHAWCRREVDAKLRRKIKPGKRARSAPGATYDEIPDP